MHEKVKNVLNRFSGFNHKHPRLVIALGVVLVCLITVRAALPTTIQWYVNRAIDKSSNYVGRIGDVDLQLIVGAYQVEDITISKNTGDVPVPLFSAEQVSFSLLWRALLHGAIVTEVEFLKADINLVDSSREEGDQTGEDGNWFDLMENLAPFRIDMLVIEDSELHFHNFEAEEQVNVTLSQINATARNISNSRKLTSDMTATLVATGGLPGNGQAQINASFNPDKAYYTFNLDGRVTDMSISALDTLIKAYAPFDVEGGNVTITTELAASKGEISGYVKPLITDLEVFQWKEDVLKDHDNPIQILWESIVGFFSEILENQQKDQLGTLVPVSGKLDQPDTDNFSAFLNILKNAFVEALNANFENTVSLDDAEIAAAEEEPDATEVESESGSDSQ